MRKILFDLWNAQPLWNSKFHGGGEYIKTVYYRLVGLCPVDFKIIVFYDYSLFLDDWILDSFASCHVETCNVQKIKDVQIIIDEVKPDVFYSGMAHLYAELNIPEKTFFCGTIHGLRGIELPYDSFAYKYFCFPKSLKEWIKPWFGENLRKKQISYYESGLKKLNSIICVSNHTMFAIKSFFPKINKTFKCYYTPKKTISSKNVESLNFSDKFILLIGCNRFVKNAYRAIVALENLFSMGMLSDYKVVAVGNFPKKILKIIQHKEKFIQFDYVSSEKLECFYAKCDFFLYPTLNEGFGMPPLEAMKYGKTCIVSGVCSLPEVCGDAVYYVNPYDINEIQNRVIMASEKKICKDKIEKHLYEIEKRQEADLNNLCNYLFECAFI